MAVAAGLGLLLGPAAHAWEEDDGEIFQAKAQLIAEIILAHQKLLAEEKAPIPPRSIYEPCLLQSIGIDVVERYLALNPVDLPWQKKLVGLRKDLQVCQALLDAAAEQAR